MKSPTEFCPDNHRNRVDSSGYLGRLIWLDLVHEAADPADMGTKQTRDTAEFQMKDRTSSGPVLFLYEGAGVLRPLQKTKTRG